MSVESPVERSRRSVLAALGGGLLGSLAHAVGRPAPAAASHAGVVEREHENNTTAETAVVTIRSTPAFRGQSPEGIGLKGVSVAGNTGLSSTGVYGLSGPPGDVSSDTSETGVFGFSDTSDDAAGVWGDSVQGTGLVGSGWAGLYAIGELGAYAQGGLGLIAVGDPGPGGVGVTGSGGTGVYGYTGPGTPPSPPANTAVHASAPSTSAFALSVNGKTRFSRSGRLVVPAGAASVSKSLAGVTTGSLVIATLQTNRAGYYIQAAVPATGSFRIYLNKAVPASTYVAYFVIN